jgi:DNA modification methylase
MSNVRVITGDATKLNVADNSIDLIITHPPYLGVDVARYGGEESDQINSSFSTKKMLKLLMKAMKEMKRVIKPSGSIFIANGSSDNLDTRFLIQALDKLGMQYHGYILQNYYSQAMDSNMERITNSHTIWHHFSKTRDIYFNAFKVKKYNDSIWNIPFSNEDDPIDKELSKNFHVLDVMNKEIPKRLIEMFSKKNHTVLDPFGGSALVAVTAAELGRIGISNDISEKQTQSGKMRATLTIGDDK